MASLFPALVGSHVVRPCFAKLGEHTPHSRFRLPASCNQPGALYLTQDVSFRAVAEVGSTVVSTVTVTRRTGRRAVFHTSCTLGATGTVVVDGTALAMLPER